MVDAVKLLLLIAACEAAIIGPDCGIIVVFGSCDSLKVFAITWFVVIVSNGRSEPSSGEVATTSLGVRLFVPNCRSEPSSEEEATTSLGFCVLNVA